MCFHMVLENSRDSQQKSFFQNGNGSSSSNITTAASWRAWAPWETNLL